MAAVALVVRGHPQEGRARLAAQVGVLGGQDARGILEERGAKEEVRAAPGAANALSGGTAFGAAACDACAGGGGGGGGAAAAGISATKARTSGTAGSSREATRNDMSAMTASAVPWMLVDTRIGIAGVLGTC